MLKFLGSLFIVSSMTGIGIWKAEEVKHSYQALGKIYHLIGMMKNELSYAGSEFWRNVRMSFEKSRCTISKLAAWNEHTDGKKRWKDIF